MFEFPREDWFRALAGEINASATYGRRPRTGRATWPSVVEADPERGVPGMCGATSTSGTALVEKAVWCPWTRPAAEFVISATYSALEGCACAASSTP